MAKATNRQQNLFVHPVKLMDDFANVLVLAFIQPHTENPFPPWNGGPYTRFVVFWGSFGYKHPPLFHLLERIQIINKGCDQYIQMSSRQIQGQKPEQFLV